MAVKPCFGFTVGLDLGFVVGTVVGCIVGCCVASVGCVTCIAGARFWLCPFDATPIITASTKITAARISHKRVRDFFFGGGIGG